MFAVKQAGEITMNNIDKTTEFENPLRDSESGKVDPVQSVIPTQGSPDQNQRENQLDQWELIGHGADGAAYLAIDISTSKPVEVRVLSNLSGETHRLGELIHRVRLITLTRCPIIRPIVQVQLHDQPPLLVLAQVAEQTLNARLETATDEDRLKLAAQLASMVRDTHRMGLIHGQLNSDSIRVDRDDLCQVDYTRVQVGQSGDLKISQGEFRLDDDLIGLHSIMQHLLRPLCETTDDSHQQLIHGRQRVVLKKLLNGDVESSAVVPPLEAWLELLQVWLPETADTHQWEDFRRLKPSPVDALDKTGEMDPIDFANIDITNIDEATTGEMTSESFRLSKTGRSLGLQPGQQLGRFRIEAEIGEGAMGTVYRGVDLADDSIVAIKVLRITGQDAGQAIRRFRKEARLLADVQNEYVTRLHEVGEDLGHHYLAMEYVEGSNLKEWLQKSGAVGEEASLKLIGDIARALGDAHSQEIVHRDIKPENVLLKTMANDENDAPQSPSDLSNFQVKLSDFGIARHVNQSSSMEVTRAGSVLGTPRYMSPEQWKATSEVGPQADVYSLGVMLFQLLTGDVPFDSTDAMKLAAMHCFDAPPSLQKRNAQISDATVQIVNRALSKEPNQRFADASQMLREIERVLRGDPLDFEAHPHLPKNSSDTIWQKTFSWNLKSSSQELWPYVSNTERLNRAIGLPSVTYRTERDPGMGLRKFGSFKLGGVQISWEEHPFEWVEGVKMGILREFDTGPFQWFMSVVSLETLEEGTTKLDHTVRIEPRNLLGRVLAKVEADWKGQRNLDRVYRRIDRYIQGKLQTKEGGDAFESPEKLSRAQHLRIDERTESMIKNGVDPEAAVKLSDYLRESSPQLLAQIRPMALAEELKVEQQEMIDTCLQAASVGLLSLGWDVLCPTCRVSATTRNALSDIRSHTHCEACDVDFQSNLGDAIELVFRAHHEIRDVDDAFYCIGGPEHSPHVLAQLRLEAGERLELSVELGAGDYLLRGPRLSRTQLLRVQSMGAPSQYEVDLTHLGRSSHIPKLRSGRQVLTLTNDLETLHVLRIERTIPRDDVITASMVSTMPLFRQLFPEQTLDRENPISSEQMTLLATTVADVDYLYEALGDAEAYRLIQHQHETLSRCITGYGGTVAKTVGESMLAAFPHCEQAVAAALEIVNSLKETTELNSLRIGIGIHRGPTLVATQNDRLDYFGATARAVQNLPALAGSDILLTDTVFADFSVQQMFADQLVSATIETVNLPGSPHRRVQRIITIEE